MIDNSNHAGHLVLKPKDPEKNFTKNYFFKRKMYYTLLTSRCVIATSG